ncbi:hypothetical protein E1264_23560 [Actinomadura sp. KC216]|uniref:hypothetical protein n=1 Tax=Actinomadura sp. KC216 TaxID=2530370 RepID=UPI001046366D|nr:hypothetical protein [Actinomadura sp. KC216]TDB84736.1 hypothetical protein E1264_23560 [Actinomadura sp. KC216]
MTDAPPQAVELAAMAEQHALAADALVLGDSAASTGPDGQAAVSDTEVSALAAAGIDISGLKPSVRCASPATTARPPATPRTWT